MRIINFMPGRRGCRFPRSSGPKTSCSTSRAPGSILEHSHRGKEYEAVQAEAIALLAELLSIPGSHQVLP